MSTSAGLDLPAPFVPVDVDLRGFGFMLDVDRLLASELVALGSPEECWAAFMLWCRAWKQRPPGSLPNDERILASFSGAGKRWPKVREMALRGFVLCSDGRLYHHVLSADANEAWKRRQEHMRKRDRDADRLRQWRERNDRATQTETPHETRSRPPPETDTKRVSTHVSSQRDRTRPDLTRPDLTEVQDLTPPPVEPLPPNPPTDNPVATGSAKTPRTTARREGLNGHDHGEEPPASRAVWQAYADAYEGRYGVKPVRNAKVNGQIANLVGRVGREEAPEIARFYVGHPRADYVRSQHSVDFLVRDCESLRTEWATDRRSTFAAARQSDSTQARGDVWTGLLDKERKVGHG